jgi:pimeloyl-ACP methyl ester carboxylesterase
VTERADLEGVTLAYTDSGGGGPVVVFVHGLGGSANSWRAQTEAAAAAGYRALAPDARGAGRSSKPDAEYSVEGWAHDLVALLDALGIDRAALVGHSVGTMVAQRAAADLGERAWALALIGGALQWRPEAGPVFEERVRLARQGRLDTIAEGVAVTGLSERARAEDPVLHGLFLELIAANDHGAYARASAATAKGRMAGLERVTCPVLALCGEHDPVTPPAFAQAIADAVPDGRSAVVPGAAHWCQLEAPAAVNEALLGFLAQARP